MVKKFEELTDSQWQVIQDLFSEQEYCDLNLRIVLNAIFWILRTGSQWRNLDSKYPKWGSVYYHFNKWKKDGRILKMNQRLNALKRYELEKNILPSMVLRLTATHIKVKGSTGAIKKSEWKQVVMSCSIK